MEVTKNFWFVSVSGCCMRALQLKLKRLKLELKHWNHHNFGNIHFLVDNK